MAYVATTRIHWHVTDEYSDAGEKVKQALLDANQTADEVKALVEKGALVTEEQWAAAVAKLEADKAKAANEFEAFVAEHRAKHGTAAAV